jgi:hypothetical protein
MWRTERTGASYDLHTRVYGGSRAAPSGPEQAPAGGHLMRDARLSRMRSRGSSRFVPGHWGRVVESQPERVRPLVPPLRDGDNLSERRGGADEDEIEPSRP